MNQTIETANRELFITLLDYGMDTWVRLLPEQLDFALNKEHNSNISQWQSSVNRLPVLTNKVTANLDAANVGVFSQLTKSEYKQSENLLRQLMPWRKGPFQIGGDEQVLVEDIVKTDEDTHQIVINTEWRSDFKWDRVQPHISPLKNRKVLDVGGGSGYHTWRMAGDGAEFVMVVDPSPLFYYQFMAIKHFINQGHNVKDSKPNVHFLPIGIEAVPSKLESFDTVFSMGVLYHRPAPFEHLQQLKDCLVKGGELVLETLVVEGDENTVLVPQGRYASMHNVYFFPSSKALCRWLKKAGFSDVRVVDENITRLEEQRQTDWMTYHSLAQFLDPTDPTKTLEGHPAPRRAVVVARK